MGAARGHRVGRPTRITGRNGLADFGWRQEPCGSTVEDRRDAGSCAPITDGDKAFGLARAYQVSAEIRAARIARGETPRGWKIGFTNRTIWDEYDVHAPIWGPVYDTTLAEAPAQGAAETAIGHLVEPRIEPEIVFRIAAPLEAGLSEAQLLERIDGVALASRSSSRSIRTGGSRRPIRLPPSPCTVCCGTARLRPSPRRTGPNGWVCSPPSRWISNATGAGRQRRAENVLGGPLSALKAMVDGLPDTALASTIGAGEVVTTGTLTRAFPVAPGESWETRVAGLPLADMAISFTR